MEKYFVVRQDGSPAAMIINGHRLVIISSDRNDLEAHLELFDGESLEQIEAEDVVTEDDPDLLEIASSVNAGVVLAPDDVDVEELIQSLEDELPWIH